jgi:hypothetical protein
MHEFLKMVLFIGIGQLSILDPWFRSRENRDAIAFYCHFLCHFSVRETLASPDRNNRQKCNFIKSPPFSGGVGGIDSSCFPELSNMPIIICRYIPRNLNQRQRDGRRQSQKRRRHLNLGREMCYLPRNIIQGQMCD